MTSRGKRRRYCLPAARSAIRVAGSASRWGVVPRFISIIIAGLACHSALGKSLESSSGAQPSINPDRIPVTAPYAPPAKVARRTLEYRPEIDGMRALAVVPVILYHAGLRWFSGGYIGVDVFFVISGFLITAIILKEHVAGTFTIAGFYERRARRILPALFFVMVVCLPFAWLWMLPNELEAFGRSVAAVALFVSNIFFWHTSGYFDLASAEKPLLHTWSLGVEEQFYLLFPLFLTMLWRSGIRRPRAWLMIIMALSFVLSEWSLHRNVDSAYYLAPMRAWELMAGAVLAVSGRARTSSGSVQPIAKNVLACCGLALILVPVFVFDDTTVFPGHNALAPVAGTMLAVVYATPETWVGRFLTMRCMVWLGTISYSAYLWHQPLFAFARLSSANVRPWWEFVALGCLSIGLAYVSHRFIEAPLRNRRRGSRRLVFVGAIATSAAFVACGTALAMSHGAAGRWSESTLKLLLPPKTDIVTCPSVDPWLQVCRIGAAGVVPTVALVGDSHADALAEQLGEALSSVGLAGYVVHTTCHPIAGFFDSREALTAKHVRWCTESDRRLRSFVTAPQIGVVIVAIRWTMRIYPMGDTIDAPGFDNGEGGVEDDLPFRNNLVLDSKGQPSNSAGLKARALLHYLDVLASAKPLVIVYPVPEVGWTPARLNLLSIRKTGHAPTSISTSWDRMRRRNATAERLLDRVRGADVRRVYPERLFCNQTHKNRCTVQEGGHLYYYDSNHLSSEGARLVVAELLKELDKLHVRADSERFNAN